MDCGTAVVPSVPPIPCFQNCSSYQSQIDLGAHQGLDPMGSTHVPTWAGTQMVRQGRQPYRPAQKKPGPSMLGLPRCRGEFQGKGQMRRRAIEQKVEARKGRRAEILEGCGIHFSLFIKQSVGTSDLVSKKEKNPFQNNSTCRL